MGVHKFSAEPLKIYLKIDFPLRFSFVKSFLKSFLKKFNSKLIFSQNAQNFAAIVHEDIIPF